MAAGSASAPSDRLNSSLPGSDRFDFDCEEEVHITPFRGGGKASEDLSSPVAMPSPVAPSPPAPANVDSSTSEAEQEMDNHPYVPDRKFRQTRDFLPRHARSKRRSSQVRGKKNICPKQNRPAPKHTGESAGL